MKLKIIHEKFITKYKKKFSNSKNLDLKSLCCTSGVTYSREIYITIFNKLNRALQDRSSVHPILQYEFSNDYGYLLKTYVRIAPADTFFQRRPILTTLFFVSSLYLLKLITTLIIEELLKKDWTSVNKSFFLFLVHIKLKLIYLFLQIKPFLIYLIEKLDLTILFLQKILKKNKNSIEIKQNFNKIVLTLKNQKKILSHSIQIPSKNFIENFLHLVLLIVNKANCIGLRILQTVSIYYLPFLYILKEVLSPSLDPRILHPDVLFFQGKAAHWPKLIIDYKILKFFSFIPGFSTILMPFFYSGLWIFWDQNIQFYIILFYFFILLKKGKQFGLNFEARYNSSVASAFLMLVTSIEILKVTLIQYVYKTFYIYKQKRFSRRIVSDLDFFFFYNLPLFLVFPMATLLFFALIYNCFLFITLGKNNYIPLITDTAKTYLEDL